MCFLELYCLRIMANSDEEEMTLASNMSDSVAQLRSSRAGKMSHVTRRMNIVNDLMTSPEYLYEIKQNMIQFNQFLEEFKAVHASNVRRGSKQRRPPTMVSA